MKKGKRKNYSVAETKAFHEKRMSSSKATENQRVYSRHWLNGFNDVHADGNLIAAERELKDRKQYVADCEKKIAREKSEVQEMKSGNKTVFGGFINGAKARIKQKKARSK